MRNESGVSSLFRNEPYVHYTILRSMPGESLFRTVDAALILSSDFVLPCAPDCQMTFECCALVPLSFCTVTLASNCLYFEGNIALVSLSKDNIRRLMSWTTLPQSVSVLLTHAL